MTPNQKKPEPESAVPEGSERPRFARFAKKLVNVPKEEIDEKAREWESRPDRPGRPKSDKAS
jgi:hypothetical protein